MGSNVCPHQLLELISQPKRRQRIRAALFPQQVQLLPSH